MLDFYCIGAQKAGTTWLYRQLQTHPEISFPGQKEVHFWDKHLGEGIDWYKNQFSDDKKQGDITPAYAILPRSLIKTCRREFPDLRFIYIVREPVSRALSALRMEVQWRKMSTLSSGKYATQLDTIRKGDYRECLDNWLHFYDRDRFLVLHFNDLSDKPLNFLRACCVHLGVDPGFFVEQESLHQKVFATKNGEVDPGFRDILQGIYGNDWEDFQNEVVRMGD